MTRRAALLREGVELERRIFTRAGAASAAERDRYQALRAELRLARYAGDWAAWPLPADRIIRVWDRETFRCMFCRNVRHESERLRVFGVVTACSHCRRAAEQLILARSRQQ